MLENSITLRLRLDTLSELNDVADELGARPSLVVRYSLYRFLGEYNALEDVDKMLLENSIKRIVRAKDNEYNGGAL